MVGFRVELGLADSSASLQRVVLTIHRLLEQGPLTILRAGNPSDMLCYVLYRWLSWITGILHTGSNVRRTRRLQSGRSGL